METTMAIIQSCAILHNIACLENYPQPLYEVKHITQLLTNELVDIENTITEHTEHNYFRLRSALILSFNLTYIQLSKLINTINHFGLHKFYVN